MSTKQKQGSGSARGRLQAAIKSWLDSLPKPVRETVGKVAQLDPTSMGNKSVAEVVLPVLKKAKLSNADGFLVIAAAYGTLLQKILGFGYG